jgi:hypothetical protein
MAFNVIAGDILSSIKYNIFIDGNAINNNKNEGRMVQMVSNS